MVPVSVLLVEDNEDILANLYAYLEPLGYELDCARNGRTGLEMAASGQFDLVVLDIMLPGLDGISLCRALREEHGVQVPVIMLTARDTVSPTGFRILRELARRAPALVLREELERRLWGDDLPGGSALRTHIHELRQHLDKPFGSPVLHTISHVGYRLGREEEPGA